LFPILLQADICHLIYKNYGTTVVEEPLNLCVRDQPISSISEIQLAGSAGSALQETLSLQSKDSKRKSKKSLARERLEKTFKEKGFLIQTQQLESAQGATYCKFRQLRKFTRYLFRSWKHHLPGDVVDNGVNSQITWTVIYLNKILYEYCFYEWIIYLCLIVTETQYGRVWIPECLKTKSMYYRTKIHNLLKIK